MKTLLIDGNNLAYRCRYTFSLSNRGVDVSVTYGFLRVLDSLMTKHTPTSVLVCFDGGIPQFRRKALPEYKATRHKDMSPEDLEKHEDFIRQVDELSDYALPLLGVITIQRKGAEADDLIYHASRMVKGDIIIVSTDRDLLQAVNDRVSLYNPSVDRLFTPEVVEEVFGVSVKDIVDWKALQGDMSDNIQGVRGVGEKTATMLMKDYGSLTNIVNAALGVHPTKQIDGKLRDNIVAFGFDKLVSNILVTALYADRVGAKEAIISAVDNFVPCSKDRLKKYLFMNAFVSLMDGNLYKNAERLVKPDLCIDNTRIPIIFEGERKAYD